MRRSVASIQSQVTAKTLRRRLGRRYRLYFL